VILLGRIERLKKSHLNLEHTKHRTVKNLSIWDHGDYLGEPIVVRKAQGLALLLDETPPIILDDELIIGLRTIYGSIKDGMNVFGGYGELPVNPATRHSLFTYPQYLTKGERAEAEGAGIMEGSCTSHVPYGAEKVMSLGFGGIEKQVRKQLRELETDSPRDQAGIDFLRAAIITLQASTRFTLKHGDESTRIAQETSDPNRRIELENISEICRRIASRPPRSFHEALQLYWLATVVTNCENQGFIPLGRIDQDLGPFLESDLERKTITRDEALELLECLWIKLNIDDDLTTDSCRNIMLSGQDSEGRDVTNELTYLCLEASANLGLTDPKVNVRFHPGSPQELWERCVEMVKLGMGGFPAFYNDEAIINGLLKMGIPIEDARLYSCDGCQEIIIPGKGDFYPVYTSVNLLECLHHTLAMPSSPEGEEYKRVSSSAVVITREHGEAKGYNSFREFIEEYERQIDRGIEDAVSSGNARDAALAKYSPVPFLSSTLEGSIENARGKSDGGTTYNFTGCNGQCFSNAVNSLAAVKKLVYDDGEVTLDGLREALLADWEGHERLRQRAINRVPKYGNDNDYVDSLAVRVASHFIDGIMGNRNPRGGPYYPGIYTFHHVTKGMSLNASPDGRRARDSVASHISPVAGTDTSGPTLALNSALKIYALGPPEGSALGLRFHPSAVRGEAGTRNLTSFIKAFMKRGGYEIQFNVVDAETLKAAQLDPDNYKSLVVRVWGFSAYFVTLTKAYQDELIARTAHGL
jgi:formate C-acetyltransferase